MPCVAPTQEGSPIDHESADVSVLIVDDQAPFRGAARTVVSLAAGFAVVGEVESGEDAVTVAGELRPDLVLMDINLPGINGYQALEILQGDPVTAHIPVLAISANAMMGDIKKGLEAGFFRYLTKPIHVSEFMEAMDAVLEVARKKGSTRMSESPLVK
jgi:CheY-like chemotaxis protein